MAIRTAIAKTRTIKITIPKTMSIPITKGIKRKD